MQDHKGVRGKRLARHHDGSIGGIESHPTIQTYEVQLRKNFSAKTDTSRESRKKETSHTERHDDHSTSQGSDTDHPHVSSKAELIVELDEPGTLLRVCS